MLKYVTSKGMVEASTVIPGFSLKKYCRKGEDCTSNTVVVNWKLHQFLMKSAANQHSTAHRHFLGSSCPELQQQKLLPAGADDPGILFPGFWRCSRAHLKQRTGPASVASNALAAAIGSDLPLANALDALPVRDYAWCK